MLDINSFSECIRTNLKKRKFGKERANAIIKDFEDRTEFYRNAGKAQDDAAVLAMRDTFDRMTFEQQEKVKRTAKTLSVLSEAADRIQQGFDADSKLFVATKDGARGSRGKAIGHAVKAIVAPDKRFKGHNYYDLTDVLKKEAFAMMGDELDKISVGAFGVQKGKAHLPNIIREIFGVRTNDASASELARSWARVADYMVDNFNAAGGSMRKLERYIPQAKNAAKLVREGEAKFVSDHLRLLDWNKTRWPDGSEIKPAERADMLKHVFNTQATDGINKIDPKAMRGRGRSVGNALEEHRFLHYADADSWLEAQERYGDGNVFDVMMRHIGDLAHRTALVETLGPNPELTMKSIQAQARKMAVDKGLSQGEIAKMNGVFQNTVDPLVTMATRTNPMNPESFGAAVVNTLSNLSTAALLGGVSLASTTGDLATTAVIRKLNKLPMMGGMNFYLDALGKDAKLARRIANSSGWAFEASTNHMYSVERFNGSAQVGPAISRRISDVVLRASGMVATTSAARFRAVAEFSAYMASTAKSAFEDLPYKDVLSRYGVTAAEWDSFRQIAPYEPKKGVQLLRPIDILKSDVANKTELFRKLQSMVLSEGKGMVPDATAEAAITLKGTTRPDTLRGALLHSFSMYKNFPFTFLQMYGQYAMTTKSAAGRMGFVTGLAAATTIGGALAVQLNELKSGRDPMNMTNGKFWLKSFLKGGGAGIWGDFLYGAANSFGGGPSDTAAGPLVGIAGDFAGVVLKEAADIYDADSLQDYHSKFPQRMVDFAHRYTPGSNLWYTQSIMNKAFWEHMENAADPQASEKRQRKMDKQKQQYGNEYYWKLGEPTPDRAPDFSKTLRREQ